MLYQGKEIGKPTVMMIEQYIRNKEYTVMPGKLYSFWNHRLWKNKKGGECKSIEEAVDMFVMMFPSYKKAKNKPKRKINKTHKKKKRFVSHKVDISYDEQLKDLRWYRFRDSVFKLKGMICEMCGSKQDLQIHHPKYINGRYAWEYEEEKMMVLCDKCHKKIHGIV